VKLLSFRLDDYRVLHQLGIPFVRNTDEASTDTSNTDYTLSFLVGVNGSGKSTVLRALFEVLRKLPTNQPIPFGFEVEYMAGVGTETQKIRVVNKPSDPLPQVFLNDDPVPRSFSTAFLPRRVVVLTTGAEEEWEKQETLLAAEPEELLDEALGGLDLDSQQLAVQELPGRPIQPINLEQLDKVTDESETPFLFIRSKYLPIVTLCGLLADLSASEKLLDDLLKEAQIESIRGFSLKFRMNRGTTSPDNEKYVDSLKEIATRKLRMGSDYLLIFDFLSQDLGYANRILGSAIREGADIQSTARGLHFYEQLVRLYDPPGNTLPVLQEITIFFNRRKNNQEDQKGVKPPLLLLNWLSDTESLILLDEPEVHFNDYWKRQIVNVITKVMQRRASHAVITTHSSITLTGAKNGNIIVLNRNGTFTSETFQPTIRTYAADPSDIIVNIFGAPQATGAQSIEAIREALNIRPEDLADPEKTGRLKLLNDLLEQVGPGYWSYQIRRKIAQLEREKLRQ
jgi:predicted ATPase